MKLTKTALNLIDSKVRLQLALALGFTEQWVIKLLNRNEDNSLLTTEAAQRIIMKGTGLAQSEILEETVLEAQK